MSVAEALGQGMVAALEATAFVLAVELDSDVASATAKSNCAKELRETLDRIRELAPPVEVEDRIDELTARRAVVLARSVGT